MKLAENQECVCQLSRPRNAKPARASAVHIRRDKTGRTMKSMVRSVLGCIYGLLFGLFRVRTVIAQSPWTLAFFLRSLRLTRIWGPLAQRLLPSKHSNPLPVIADERRGAIKTRRRSQRSVAPVELLFLESYEQPLTPNGVPSLKLEEPYSQGKIRHSEKFHQSRTVFLGPG